MKYKDVITSSADALGLQNCLLKFIEESAEAAEVCAKALNGDVRPRSIAEELVDVEITLHKVVYAMSKAYKGFRDDFIVSRNYKTSRLEKYVQNRTHAATEGCEGCRYIGTSETDQPCRECYHNYVNRYEPAPEPDDDDRTTCGLTAEE